MISDIALNSKLGFSIIYFLRFLPTTPQPIIPVFNSRGDLSIILDFLPITKLLDGTSLVTIAPAAVVTFPGTYQEV